MVQITSVVLAALLIAPSLAVPIINGQQFNAREEALAVREPSSGIDADFELSERDVQELEEILERDPNIFGKVFRGIRKVATPGNLGKVAKIASWVIRDLDAVELSERDIQELEEMIERDPSWFSKAFRSIRKVASPANLGKVANVASNFIREENISALSERDLAELEELEDLVARDPSFFSKAFKRIRKIATPGNLGKAANLASNFIREDELEALAELAARDPSWFSKAFRSIKRIASPANIGKVANVASNFIREEDLSDLSERDLADLDALAELAARNPSFFSKAFRRIKKIATPGNLGKAANLASNFIREDELEALSELAARDPSWFSKAFRSIRKIASPGNIGKVANVASNFIREDAEEVDDLLAREYEEFDELD